MATKTSTAAYPLAIALATLALGATLAVPFSFQNRIWPGVVVAGIAVGGKTPQEARQLLETGIQSALQTVTLESHGKTYRFESRELGVLVPLAGMVAEAYGVGRGKTTRQNLRELLSAVRDGWNIPLAVEINADRLAEALRNSLVHVLTRKPRDARIVRRDEIFEIEPGADGIGIAYEPLASALRERLETLDAGPIEIPFQPQPPRLTTARAGELAEKANRILSRAPYVLSAAGKHFEISRTLVADWLKFDRVPDMTFDRAAMREYLIGIAPAIAQQAQNAEASADTEGNLRIAKPSQDRLELDTQRTLLSLTQAFEQRQRLIDAEFARTPARLNETLLRELGITKLLGRGKSNFAGSPKSRAHNIGVSAERYRGVLVRAGEQFSFNALLGNIGPETGYQPELVIKKKKLVREYGGGICQVSTTLFRAAVAAGMQITERFAHSMPVRYYNPQGFDATVYPPAPDLKFANNTPGTILIQPRIEGTALAFEIYGAPVSRTVVIEGPRVIEARPDGSLKTVLTQKITENGKVVYQKSFWSNYQSPQLFKVERNPLE